MAKEHFVALFSKIFLVMAIIVSLGMVLGITKYLAKNPKIEPSVCQFSPVPSAKDEIADWQTYRNNEFGFEFKYPSKFGEVIFEVNPESFIAKGEKIGMRMEGKFSDNSSIIFGGVTNDYTAVSRETSKVGYFGGYLENNGVYFYGKNEFYNEFYGEMMPKKIINDDILLIDCKSFVKQCLIVDSYMMSPYTIEEEIENKIAGLINLKNDEFKGLIISANSEFIKEDDFTKILSTVKTF